MSLIRLKLLSPSMERERDWSEATQSLEELLGEKKYLENVQHCERIFSNLTLLKGLFLGLLLRN